MEEQQNLLNLIKQQQMAGDLEELKSEALKCRKCPLRQGCQQVVFGEGNASARLMLVGEGPGSEEDRLGAPFVGAAGRLLDRILSAAEISREEIYITNIVKCRPPGNRAPVKDEIAACLPYLDQQIQLINPEIVLCLGATSARTLIDSNFKITKDRGNWYKKHGILYTATFHPAALLRDPGKKAPVWDDIQRVRDVYRGIDQPPL